METIAIVLRRSRKKMSAEETRIDIKKPMGESRGELREAGCALEYLTHDDGR